jgi:hypothetical protein
MKYLINCIFFILFQIITTTIAQDFSSCNITSIGLDSINCTYCLSIGCSYCKKSLINSTSSCVPYNPDGRDLCSIDLIKTCNIDDSINVFHLVIIILFVLFLLASFIGVYKDYSCFQNWNCRERIKPSYIVKSNDDIEDNNMNNSNTEL